MAARPIKGESIPNPSEGFSSSIIRSVAYGDAGLIVEVEDSQIGPESTLVVSFQSVYGFRVLDEGDLNDFWNGELLGGGVLFKIAQGGWLDQELARPGFVGAYSGFSSEYFVTGNTICVNVIAGNPPTFAPKG